MKRRAFLQSVLTTAVAPVFVPREVLASPGRPGANDRFAVGVIGTGGRARSLMNDSPPDLKLVALADCDRRQTRSYEKWARETIPDIASEKMAKYQDYRKMLDQEKLDAVLVTSTTHSRVSICLDAMMTGLDVYAEKPLTLTIDEGHYLIRAEKKFGTVFQVGTQQRSVPINRFGSRLIREGAIGKVHTVLCPNFIGPEKRPDLGEERKPEEIDWDLWCHQTERIPFTSKLHPGLGRWGKWRDYDGGGLSFGVTGWGAHAFDQVQVALGTDDTTPVEIWPEEEPSSTARVSLRYANGTVMKLDYKRNEGPGLGAIFLGEKGRIEMDRNLLIGNPPELVTGAPEPDDTNVLASVSKHHLRNWVDCMRTRSKTNTGAEIGHRSTVICHLVNICRELGRKLEWNPEKEEFVGDDEANALRSRPRRKGFELPEIV